MIIGQVCLLRKCYLHAMNMVAKRLVQVQHQKWAWQILPFISSGKMTNFYSIWVVRLCSLFRGLKHRNLSAIRHATQRGIHQLQQLHHHNNSEHGFLMKNRNSPLLIQGLRTNPKGIFIIFAWLGCIWLSQAIWLQMLRVTFFSLILRVLFSSSIARSMLQWARQLWRWVLNTKCIFRSF